MSPDDPRHGRRAGYLAGCGCTPCFRANSVYLKRYKHARATGAAPRKVDGTGFRRRAQALMAIGWPRVEIEHRMGWSSDGRALGQAMRRKTVYARTDQRMAEVYDDLWATPGPSVKTRQRALAAGWPEPMAWDDIGNPASKPRSVSDRTTRRIEETIEDWLLLRSEGFSRAQAAERLDMPYKTLQKALERAVRRGLLTAEEALPIDSRHRAARAA